MPIHEYFHFVYCAVKSNRESFKAFHVILLSERSVYRQLIAVDLKMFFYRAIIDRSTL